MDTLWLGQSGRSILARDSKEEDFLEEAGQEQVVFTLPYTKRNLYAPLSQAVWQFLASGLEGSKCTNNVIVNLQAVET